MPHLIHSHPLTDQPIRLDQKSLRRLHKLMKRDKVDYTEFLRRAVEAYDLMYTRDN